MPQVVTWSQARELGLPNYFTGIPCKRGHVSERTFSSGMCKQCSSESNVIWMKKNPGKRHAWRKDYVTKNIERVRKWKTDWRKNNLEKCLEIERRTLAKIKQTDPERYRKQASLWQKNNPDKVRAREARRRAQKNAAGGKFTALDLKSLFDRQSGKCAYCFVKLGKNYHADHIVPIAKGGTSWPDNIQLCCPTCNISKGAKDHVDFARYIGRLI